MILLIQKHFDKLEALQREMLDDARRLRPEQQIFRPEPNAWSILEVFDHLITAEGNGLKYMVKKSQGMDTIKKTNLLAKLRLIALNVALKLPFKWKAPPAAEITRRDYYDFEEIAAEWNDVRKRYSEFLDHIDKAASEKLLFKHPVAGRFTIIQTLDFQHEHLAHHQLQIERIKQHAEYPK